MDRFDQGHLHPKLEVLTPETDMSRPGTKSGPPWWEASTLAKSYSDSVLIANRNINISPRDSWIIPSPFFWKPEIWTYRYNNTITKKN